MKPIDKLTEPWEDIRNESLRNPEVAALYLNLIFEDGNEDEIRSALRHVIEANNDAVSPSIQKNIVEMTSLMRRHGLALTIRPISRRHRAVKSPTSARSRRVPPSSAQ
ncbi:MAG TPA: hypothetical protein VG537_11375 [Candidatus Kapabacteria bacterium]|jgi:hypothetical protein|nr:hypothetical protein [Candidatus Kapabacteria bacterium]